MTLAVYFKNVGGHQHGISLLELLTTIAILGILVSVAIPSYENYKDKKNGALAKRDILDIQKAVDLFYITNNQFPASLSQIGMDKLIDPWGTPYFYVNVVGYDPDDDDSDDDSDSHDGGDGDGDDDDVKVRRDKLLKPVNTDFDLYSAGKDKETKAPFSAKASRDDIIRCNNGGYLGYVKDY